jgi:pyridoxine 5'-phosphate synthase PdxJ
MSSTTTPLEKLAQDLSKALIEHCEQLKAERDLYRSLLQEAEKNAASEKERLEAQIIELHRQNYALVDVNKRLTNLLQEESHEEFSKFVR